MIPLQRLLCKSLGLKNSEIPRAGIPKEFVEELIQKAPKEQLVDFYYKAEEFVRFDRDNRKRHIHAIQRASDQAEKLVCELQVANEEKQQTLNRLSDLVAFCGDKKPVEAMDQPQLIERIEALVEAHKTHSLQMEEACHDAENATEARTTFLANMSHEIRTPMNGIMGTLNLIADSHLDQEQADNVDVIRRSTQALVTVLNDILDFSKIQEGRLDIEETSFRLSNTCRDVISIFSAAAAQKNIELILEIDEQLPEIVNGDEGRIRQILNNLVGNAVKFTSVGRVTLHASAGSNDSCVFAVSDSGIGIDSETAARLFVPFSQADRSITRKFGGTGLGLSISKTLSELMGGTIVLDSIPNAGSTFTFTVPLPPGKPTTDAKSATAPKSNLSPFASLTTTEPLQILVAEDNPINQLVARRTLKKLGHGVTVAGNGEEAVNSAASQDFDVILMDMEMPILDGVKASQLIRELPDERGQVPIIAMTGHVLQESRTRCLEAGMSGFIPKPFDLVELTDALHTFSKRHETAVGAPAPASLSQSRATPSDGLVS